MHGDLISNLPLSKDKKLNEHDLSFVKSLFGDTSTAKVCGNSSNIKLYIAIGILFVIFNLPPVESFFLTLKFSDSIVLAIKSLSFTILVFLLSKLI
jgi:hypothetical protein